LVGYRGLFSYATSLRAIVTVAQSSNHIGLKTNRHGIWNVPLVREEEKRLKERRALKKPEEEEKETDVPETPITIPQTDSTEEKVEGGTACLPCSRDHFSTVSGALGEAMRFARKDGIKHPEVQRRLGMALDELNMLERIDLSDEQMVTLKGKEKQLAAWGLTSSRELRHQITTVQSVDDLERASSDASSIRTDFMRKLWDVASIDGSIDKLCRGLKDEDKARCMATIATVLDKKNRMPP